MKLIQSFWRIQIKFPFRIKKEGNFSTGAQSSKDFPPTVGATLHENGFGRGCADPPLLRQAIRRSRGLLHDHARWGHQLLHILFAVGSIRADRTGRLLQSREGVLLSGGIQHLQIHVLVRPALAANLRPDHCVSHLRVFRALLGAHSRTTDHQQSTQPVEGIHF